MSKFFWSDYKKNKIYGFWNKFHRSIHITEVDPEVLEFAQVKNGI